MKSKKLITWSTSTDTLGIVGFLEKMVDTTNWVEPIFRLIVTLLNIHKLLGVVGLLEKTVDTIECGLKPGFCLVIALLNNGRSLVCVVFFSNMNA